MDKTLCAQTFLSVLPEMSKFREIAAVSRHRRILRDLCTSPAEAFEDQTFRFLQKVEDHAYKTQMIENLYGRIMRQLGGAHKKTAGAARLFFLERKPVNEVAAAMGTERRAARNNINNAVEFIAGRLDAIGVTPEVFREILAGFPWIRRTHEYLRCEGFSLQ